MTNDDKLIKATIQKNSIAHHYLMLLEKNMNFDEALNKTVIDFKNLNSKTMSSSELRIVKSNLFVSIDSLPSKI